MGMDSNVGSKNSLISEIIASVNHNVLSIATEHQQFQPETHEQWLSFFGPPGFGAAQQHSGNDKGDFHPRDTCDRDITTHWQVPSRS